MTSGRALVGRVISNRYRILALIGEGGMGTVYVAEHLLIGRKVAVKRLHPELAADERAVARFQREARAAGSTASGCKAGGSDADLNGAGSAWPLGGVKIRPASD